MKKDNKQNTVKKRGRHYKDERSFVWEDRRKSEPIDTLFSDLMSALEPLERQLSELESDVERYTEGKNPAESAAEATAPDEEAMGVTVDVAEEYIEDVTAGSDALEAVDGEAPALETEPERFMPEAYYGLDVEPLDFEHEDIIEEANVESEPVTEEIPDEAESGERSVDPSELEPDKETEARDENEQLYFEPDGENIEEPENTAEDTAAEIGRIDDDFPEDDLDSEDAEAPIEINVTESGTEAFITEIPSEPKPAEKKSGNKKSDRKKKSGENKQPDNEKSDSSKKPPKSKSDKKKASDSDKRTAEKKIGKTTAAKQKSARKKEADAARQKAKRQKSLELQKKQARKNRKKSEDKTLRAKQVLEKQRSAEKAPNKHVDDIEIEEISPVRRVFGIIKKILSWALVIALGVTIVSFVMVKVGGGTPTMFGYSIQRIVSGSMEPTLMVGDIILSKSVSSPDEVSEGDIITFQGDETYSNQLVTHRAIISPAQHSDGSYFVITQGDANEGSDGEIPFDSVKYKYVDKINFFNSIFDFFLSPWGLLIFVGVIILIFLDDIMNIVKIVTGNYKDEDAPDESIGDIIKRLKREQEERELAEKLVRQKKKRSNKSKKKKSAKKKKDTKQTAAPQPKKHNKNKKGKKR